MSSTTRSRIVCSRRAPMFCVGAVHLEGDVGQRLDAVRREFELSRPSVASSSAYCLVSECFGSVRMRRKSASVQVGQLDADREAALQFRHQVRRLGQVKRPGRDEQDVIGPHRAVAGVDRGAFDHRQQIALHALARDVGALRSTAGRRPCRARRGR